MELEPEPEPEPEAEPESQPDEYYNTRSTPNAPPQVPEYSDITHAEDDVEENLYDVAVEPSGKPQLPEDLYDEAGGQSNQLYEDPVSH